MSEDNEDFELDGAADIERRDAIEEEGQLPDESPDRLSSAAIKQEKSSDENERGWWEFYAGPGGKFSEYAIRPLERITSQNDLDGVADAMAKELLLLPPKIAADILKGLIFLSSVAGDEALGDMFKETKEKIKENDGKKENSRDSSVWDEQLTPDQKTSLIGDMETAKRVEQEQKEAERALMTAASTDKPDLDVGNKENRDALETVFEDRPALQIESKRKRKSLDEIPNDSKRELLGQASLLGKRMRSEGVSPEKPSEDGVQASLVPSAGIENQQQGRG